MNNAIPSEDSTRPEGAVFQTAVEPLPQARIVLIVEDDEVPLLLMSRCLQKIGCSVLQARNGKEAMELMKHSMPHLILLDSAMPIMNGAKFRQLQLRDTVMCSIPTVLVSAIDDAERKKGILASLHFLAKPINIDHLLSTVNYFVCAAPVSQVL
jgi:CheY-like chemotaxis protein